MTDPENLIGSSIDHFRLEKYLGAGAAGMVFLARDAVLHRPVALRLIFKEASGLPLLEEAHKRFIEGVRASVSLHHDNIAAIHGYGETGEFRYICMEYVSGKTIEALLAEQRVLPLGEAARIFKGILLALDAAHRAGMVHRNINPANIMIGEAGTVKVMDFGIAAPPFLFMTQMRLILGTSYSCYTSPEQVAGGEADIRSDIFSVGAVLYHAINGAKPFHAESAANLAHNIVRAEFVSPNRDIPYFLDAVCKKALAKDPGARYQTPTEMLHELTASVQTVAFPGIGERQAEEPDRRFSERVGSGSGKGAIPRRPSGAEDWADIEKGGALSSRAAINPKTWRLHGKRRTGTRFFAAIAVLGLVAIIGGLVIFRGPDKTSRIRPQPEAPRNLSASNAGPASKVAPKATDDPRAVQPSPDPNTASPDARNAGPSRDATSPAPNTASPDIPNAGPSRNEAALSPPPVSIDSLLRRARNEWDSNPADAQELLEKAVALDPSNSDAVLQLARLLTVRKDYPAAIRQYQNALRINNRLPDAYFNLGYIFLIQGENRLAVSNYEACSALGPPYLDEVLSNMGVAYKRMGSRALAKSYFQKALDVNPVNKLALHNLMRATKEEHRDGKPN